METKNLSQLIFYSLIIVFTLFQSSTSDLLIRSPNELKSQFISMYI